MTGKKFNLFIRGIFSTVLTSLFTDAGYNIIDPSTSIKKRFELEEKPELYSKDIVINDKFGEGVSVNIKHEIWDKIKDDFPLSLKNFPNAIQLISKFPLNSIYRGIVFQSSKLKRFSLVNLIPTENIDDGDTEDNFTTTVGKLNRFLKVGTEGVFQIRNPDSGRNYALINQGYTVSGDLAVIMPDYKRGLISKQIRDKKTRDKLLKIIEKVSVNDFGILLRTAAKNASDIEILREIQHLREKHIEIESLINQTHSTIGRVWSEFESFSFIFSNPAKLKLDEIRSQIIPTVSYHHDIKTNGDFGSTFQLKILNFTESVLNELNALGFNEKINFLFQSFYYNNLFRPKQLLYIFHDKLSGRRINLTPGIIKKIVRNRSISDHLKIILRRNLNTSVGTYDGLNIPIEEGDYAIGVYESGKMYYESIYYSRYNELKGRYFNINTPIMFRGDGIHYIDLEIDVVEPLNGKRKIIDADLLNKAFDLNIISKNLYDQAIDIAHEIESGAISSEIVKTGQQTRIMKGNKVKNKIDLETDG